MTAPSRHVSSAEAAGLVQSGDWVDYGAVLAQPDAFDTALAARAEDLERATRTSGLLPRSHR